MTLGALKTLSPVTSMRPCENREAGTLPRRLLANRDRTGRLLAYHPKANRPHGRLTVSMVEASMLVANRPRHRLVAGNLGLSLGLVAGRLGLVANRPERRLKACMLEADRVVG